VHGVVFSTVKQPECEADHSCPSNAGVKSLRGVMLKLKIEISSAFYP
jgi:hypothetical protein